MKTKELAETFERMTESYKKEMLPSYDEGGYDYEETKEAHKEFIKNMKLKFYDLLREYNITVSEGGPYAEQCDYVEKILALDDEKQIIKKQKELMYECAKYAFDITSDSRDENESDERDAKNRKIKPTQAVQDFKGEARNQLYGDASNFEFLANDFYTENINNLIHFLSSRGVSERQLESIHFDLTQECRVLARKDVDNYHEMILGDSNRSFSDLERKQEEMFSIMDDIVRTKELENDPFGTLTPEERKEHEAKVKEAIAESKENSQEDKDKKHNDDWTLPESFL